MAQHYSRMCIKVRGTGVWKRLHDIKTQKYNLGANGEEVFSSKKKMITISDWSCDEDGILKLVKDVAKRLRNDGIVIADTTNINVDPYEYGVYYLGGKVHEFLYDDSSEKSEMFDNTSIEDISNWINYAECSVSASEKRTAEEFGVKVSVNKEVKAISKTKYGIEYYLRFVDSVSKEKLITSIPFLNTDRLLSEEIDRYKQNGGGMFDIDEAKADISFGLPNFYQPEDAYEYVEKASQILKTEGIMIAYAWNFKDPSVYVVYYLGDKVTTFECDPKVWGYDDLVKVAKTEGLALDEIVNIKDIKTFLGPQYDKLTNIEKTALEQYL